MSGQTVAKLDDPNALIASLEAFVAALPERLAELRPFS
jgi:hypothetical protein